MTSTSFNVGINEGNRVSSRVLRPPGGGHTDIFGGDPEPPRGRRLLTGAPDQMQQSNGAAAPAPAPVAVTAEEPSHNGASHVEEPAAPAPAPEPVKPVSQPEKVQEPPKAEPPKRVRVPPGGFSSGLW